MADFHDLPDAERSPDAMNAERFAELVGIYGGRIERWPTTSQDAAHRYAATDEGRNLLMTAIELDVILESYVVAPPNAALVGRILAAAPHRDRPSGWTRRWIEGLGFFGVGVAGLVAGSLAVAIVQSGPSPDTDGFFEQPTTVFGDVGKMTASLEEAQ